MEITILNMIRCLWQPFAACESDTYAKARHVSPVSWDDSHCLWMAEPRPGSVSTCRYKGPCNGNRSLFAIWVCLKIPSNRLIIIPFTTIYNMLFPIFRQINFNRFFRCLFHDHKSLWRPLISCGHETWKPHAAAWRYCNSTNVWPILFLLADAPRT